MKLTQLISVCALAAIALVGCGGGSPYDPSVVNPPPPTNTSFFIGEVADQEILINGSVDIPVTVFKTLVEQTSNGLAADGDVTLSVSGLPEDMNASFSANPVTPTFEGTNLTLHVAYVPQGGTKHLQSELPSEYTLTITGTDGVSTHSVTTTLRVVFTTDSFDLSAPSEKAAEQNDTVTIPVTITRNVNGDKGRAILPVHVSATGGQPGSTMTFTVDPVTPTDEGAQTNLTIDTGNGEGEFLITITANDGYQARQTTTLLIVSGGNQPS